MIVHISFSENNVQFKNKMLSRSFGGFFVKNTQIHNFYTRSAKTSSDIGLRVILKSLLLIDIKDQKYLTFQASIFNLPLPSQHLSEA